MTVVLMVVGKGIAVGKGIKMQAQRLNEKQMRQEAPTLFN
jgi:hypothetical protein